MRNLMKTSALIANPLYDGRATAGIRTLRSFAAGTVFAIRKHFRTGEIVSVAILWDETAHTITATSVKFEDVFDAFTAVASPYAPQTYAEAMVMLDQYWSAPTGSPAEDVLDMLLRTDTNEARAALIENLRIALEEME